MTTRCSVRKKEKKQGEADTLIILVGGVWMSLGEGANV